MWYLELFSLLNSVFGFLGRMIESVMERYSPIDVFIDIKHKHRAVLKRCIRDRHKVRLETKVTKGMIQSTDKKMISSLGLRFRTVFRGCCGQTLAWRVGEGMDFIAQW
jgi:hypothetical protein